MGKRTLKRDKDGYVNGHVIADPCRFMTDESLEQWLDHLSNELTGTELLSDISFKAVSVRKGEITYLVGGSMEFIDENDREIKKLDAKTKGA